MTFTVHGVPITVVEPADHAQRPHRHAEGLRRDRRPQPARRHLRPLDGRSSTSTSPTPRSSCARTARAASPASSRSRTPDHRARRLRAQLRPLRHDEPDARARRDDAAARRRRPRRHGPASTAPAGKDGANGRDAELRVDPPQEGAVQRPRPRCTCACSTARPARWSRAARCRAETLRLGVLSRHHAQGHLPAQADRQEGLGQPPGDGDDRLTSQLSDRCLDLGDTCR